MTMTIKTDSKWRNLRYRNEVPAKVLADQFGYQDPEETIDGFFRYRGYWYHIDDFMRCSGHDDLKGWHGYAADSYFSGVLIKLSEDGEQVQCATYIS